MKATILALSYSLTLPLWCQQYHIDRPTLDRIRGEALDRSQAAEYAIYLSDVFGPRLTGSPNFRAAGDWAMRTLRSIGLQDVHPEPLGVIDFADGLPWSGRGWSFSRCSVRMIEPQEVQLVAVPAGWSRSTTGRVRGDTVLAPLPQGPDQVDQYIAAFRGKLKGKIVLTSRRTPIRSQGPPEFSRFSNEDLAKLALPPEPQASPRSNPPSNPPAGNRGPEPGVQDVVDEWNKLLDFLHDEDVLALVQAAGGRGGTLFTTNQLGPPDPRHDPPPTVSIAAEQYNRLLRLKDKGIPVRMEIELETRFYPKPHHFNVLADIPGTSKKEEVVLVGAHLDSWFGATGATDNAAGVAVVMEAMRILDKLDLKMTRTVRAALWDAEEVNAGGSKAYAREHLVDAKTGVKKPLYDRLSVYLNIDNGGGKIRGVYLQGNKAAVPVFAGWLNPFSEFGAATVSIRDSEGSDHETFDRAGIPAFAVIQDPLNYMTRTHHSTMDYLDSIPADDLKTSALVLAALIYEAANDPAMVPRKPASPQPPGGAK
jgi:carboxypeptidase Q